MTLGDRKLMKRANINFACTYLYTNVCVSAKENYIYMYIVETHMFCALVVFYAQS